MAVHYLIALSILIKTNRLKNVLMQFDKKPIVRSENNGEFIFES